MSERQPWERPLPFFIVYMEPTFWQAVERGEADPDDWDPYDVVEEEFGTLEEAIGRARSDELVGLLPQVHERLDISPFRDPDQPRVIISWDWRDRFVTDDAREWRPGDPPVHEEPVSALHR